MTASTMSTMINRSQVRYKDSDPANGVQEPCNGGKTANSCAQNSGSRSKLAATLTTNEERAVGNPQLRRASVSEEITLKRKGTGLDRYVTR